ncbi:PaREP1 family protein [Candidatus Poriferisodalis sp.]|uniref:PaREP1 family protein n=1 Tax=Candidatus Poriferisodalis sp. TaxID=3101277 RepID=UPI003B01C187
MTSDASLSSASHDGAADYSSGLSDAAGQRAREPARSAACGGEAVHGDWRLSGTDIAAADYVEQAREFIERSRAYLADDQLHQASEKGWGAAAHMAKAVALTQGWDYETHADFSVVLNNAYRRLGDERIRLLRSVANDLHGNFYRRKRFLDADIIGRDLENVNELVDALTPLAAPG